MSVNPADAAELNQARQAMDLTLRAMDRSFATLDQAQDELGRAKSDLVQAKVLAAAIFNGPGPRAPLLHSAYRSAVLESDDIALLKSVLVDAWKKSDWAFTQLATGGGQA